MKLNTAVYDRRNIPSNKDYNTQVHQKINHHENKTRRLRQLRGLYDIIIAEVTRTFLEKQYISEAYDSRSPFSVFFTIEISHLKEDTYSFTYSIPWRSSL